MKLTKPMLRVFSYLIRGENTLIKITQALKKSKYWTDIIINQLEKEGFIIKKRNYTMRGSRILVEVANTPHALKLKELLYKYPGISFEDLITEGRLLFLAAISEDWINTKGAVQLSGISKYTIDRYLSELKNRGVIEKNKNLYRINQKAWPLLKEFLMSYKNYSSLEGQVKWKFNNEILYEVNHKELIQDNATGFYRYKDYSIKVGLFTALCILPRNELSKEEVFVHSLFEVKDPRTLHLALTFYIKNNLNYKKVLPVTMKYGKYSMFDNFIKILKTKEEKVKFDNLPVFDKKDFIRIAKMYGVKNV